MLTPRPRALALTTLAATLATVAPALADGTEALGPASIDIAAGSDVTIAGTGLLDGQPGSIDIEVAGAVEQVILYWEGSTTVAALHTATDALTLNGAFGIVGDRIGGVTELSAGFWTATYRADITDLGLIVPGANSITIEGMDFDQRNNGAGLLVITDDGVTTADLDVRDGNDFAFINRPVPLNGTAEVEYTFDPAGMDRIATVDMMVSSVALEGPGGGFGRPSVIRISVDGSVVLELVDQLANSDGPEWDSISPEVTVPAGATSVSAQIFSEDAGGEFAGNLEASLVWVASGLTLVTPELPDGGACCFDDGTCQEGLEPYECECFGGTYQGDGTLCADVDCTPEEGCHPRFWKRYCNLSLWPEPYEAHTPFGDVFVDAFPGKNLRQVVRRRGWGIRALGRETVAALLNAASPDVNYPYTEDEVINMFNDAYECGPGARFVLWHIFACANRQHCPLWAD